MLFRGWHTMCENGRVRERERESERLVLPSPPPYLSPNRDRAWAKQKTEGEREREDVRTLVRTKVKHSKFPKHFCLASRFYFFFHFFFPFIRYNRRFNYTLTENCASSDGGSGSGGGTRGRSSEQSYRRQTRGDIFSATIIRFAIFSSLVSSRTRRARRQMCTLRYNIYQYHTWMLTTC